ncbi:hypothetical protein B0H10DRAFT_1944693 [Mycena sp. CBHHK59/15]|nr:hypothetical protein B0H10DRAFT_1944693 [Mycena sp. CBHHK59/15]
MSGTGVTYYDEELNLSRENSGRRRPQLSRIPSQEKVIDTGGVKTVVSHALEVSFGAHQTPAGEKIIPTVKTRGPVLDEVVTVLRNHITGNAGTNLLLTLWVDNLKQGPINAIETSSAPLPRRVRTTLAKHLLEDEKVQENTKKRQKMDASGEGREESSDGGGQEEDRAGTYEHRLMRLKMKWVFDDLEDDPTPEPKVTVGPGALKMQLLDKLAINCHSKKDPETCCVCCSGAGCHESWAQPRMSSCILPHASDCKYLDQKLHAEALLVNAGKSLGVQVAATETEDRKKDFFGAFKCIGVVGKAAAAFCALVDHLEPGNGIEAASTFSENYVPAEATRVTLLAIAELKEHYNLNLGHDYGAAVYIYLPCYH